MENSTTDRDQTGQTGSFTSPEEAVNGKRSLASALRKAADDAKSAAERSVPRIKAAASEAAYWTAYGLAFAAVFQWTVAKAVTPETVKKGCREGVQAGKGAAQEWIEKLKRSRKGEPENPMRLLGEAASNLSVS